VLTRTWRKGNSCFIGKSVNLCSHWKMICKFLKKIKNKTIRSSLVAPWVKDLTLSWHQLQLLLWCRSDSIPGPGTSTWCRCGQKKKNCHVIQQFRFWILIGENENTNPKRYTYCHGHWSIIYNSQDMEATQVPINRWNTHKHTHTHTHTHTQWNTTQP